MKILFIVQAIDYIDPIGLMLISAIAKTKGHETHLAILSRENILDKISKLKPDIVAYSASTGEHKYYFQINEVIKSKFKDIFTIMGGPHTTFYPECVNETTLDAVCVGEGDEAFAELLDNLKDKKDISGIRNIFVKGKVFTGTRPLYENLDTLPFPDRELFYLNTEMGEFPLKSFMVSRGCPYRCTYCFNHAFRKLYKDKGMYLRRHSVDYVIEQILRVKKDYELSFVKFYDDIFIYKIDNWFEEFVKKYKEKIGLPFHCLIRADIITDEMAKLLKEAGCFSISMSIETANPYLRNEILKRDMGEEEIKRGFAICYKYDIKTFSNNILAIPHSRIDDDIKTVDLNIECKVSFAEFPIFHPYPGTELGDLCIKEGLYDKNYEGLHMSYMEKSPLLCFTNKEKNIQKNISELGLAAVMFPSLRNLILNHLIYWPNNKLFFLIYYFCKAYLINKKVYPFKIKPQLLWRLFLKSLRLESFKRTKEILGEADEAISNT